MGTLLHASGFFMAFGNEDERAVCLGTRESTLAELEDLLYVTSGKGLKDLSRHPLVRVESRAIVQHLRLTVHLVEKPIYRHLQIELQPVQFEDHRQGYSVFDQKVEFNLAEVL
jgi:hypothetical protein